MRLLGTPGFFCKANANTNYLKLNWKIMNKGEGMGIFFLLNSVSGKIFSFHWREIEKFFGKRALP
jgi:hypothetical protein